MKPHIKSYLSVTKKEWNGMVLLVVLIALILAAPYVYQLIRKDTIINIKDFDKAVSALDKAKKSQPVDDPGNATEASDGKHAITYYKKAAPGTVIELNTADSARLTQVRGIGPSFARRIITYRNRLGGFYRKEQLMEVFGLDSTIYAQIKPGVNIDASHIHKININTVAFNELSRFPYLSYKQINALIRFRDEHGDYEMLSDLKNVVIMDDNTLHRIKPYIKFK